MSPPTITGLGVIAFANNIYWAVKMKPEGAKMVYSIYVPTELVQQVYGVSNGDFVKVTATKWEAPSGLSFTGITYKATAARWHGHPKMIEGQARVHNTDPNGEFCFLEYVETGKLIKIFAVRTNWRPEVPSLAGILKAGDSVTFRAQEQPFAGGNQADVRFKTVYFTHANNSIDADGTVTPKVRAVPGTTPKARGTTATVEKQKIVSTSPAPTTTRLPITTTATPSTPSKPEPKPKAKPELPEPRPDAWNMERRRSDASTPVDNIVKEMAKLEVKAEPKTREERWQADMQAISYLTQLLADGHCSGCVAQAVAKSQNQTPNNNNNK